MTPGPPLLVEAAPVYAAELRRHLDEFAPDLALIVESLRIVKRCICSQESCASFHSLTLPEGSTHSDIGSWLGDGFLDLGVITEQGNRQIAFVDLTGRPDLRKELDVVCVSCANLQDGA